jgi:hypothetical protein
LPTIIVGETARSRRRNGGGAGWWLKGAKEAKKVKKARKAKTQRACRGKQNPDSCSYTPMEGQRAGEKVGAVFTFNDLT